MVLIKYAGIDESNKGRSPEIWTIIASAIEEDIEEFDQGHYPKRKHKNSVHSVLGIKKNTGRKRNADMFELLNQKRALRFAILPEEYKKIFQFHDLPIIMCSELIAAFSGLEKVVIDGQIKDIQKLRDIARMRILAGQGVRTVPTIAAFMYGDTKFRVVNIADFYARQLFRKHDSAKKPYADVQLLSHIITPRLEDYLDLLPHK